MACIAILLPRDDMLQPAHEIAQRYQLDVISIYAVHTSTVLDKAEEVIRAGAEIIIARGIQAMLLKRHTTVSLVEIQLTGQEMALLITKAKNLVNKPCPVVGVVGFKNMFCDISSLNQLLGVRLNTYFVEEHKQMAEAVSQAKADGVDVLIGGDAVCSCAAENQISSVFIASGPESIAEACRVAKYVSYAMDQQKRNAAEFKAILDYTVSGLVQIDTDGMIRNINHSAEQMLSVAAQQAIEHPVWTFLNSLNEQALAPVLSQGQELYSLRLRRNSALFLATVSPVFMDEKVTGAIISITESQQLELYADEQRKELIRQGFTAPFTFDTIIARSPQAQALTEKAKRYAKFNTPVLILGEFGTEKEELAQCIHNASIYADSAFVHFNCDSSDPSDVEERLLGPQGLAKKAQGILFLNEVSRLSPVAQYRLYCLICGRPNSSFGDLEPRYAPLRVLAADTRNLAALVRSGAFREDLYYALSVITLSIPPLRQRKEDISGWAEYFFQELQQRHGRYVHLVRGAWQRLLDYDWPGNLAQLRNLCERVIVESPRRTVDEAFLGNQLSAYGSVQRQENPHGPAAVYCDPKAARIAQLLYDNHGSRSIVAKELGVSTTTLWRYIKKYGIQI